MLDNCSNNLVGSAGHYCKFGIACCAVSALTLIAATALGLTGEALTLFSGFAFGVGMVGAVSLAVGGLIASALLILLGISMLAMNETL